MLKEKFREWLKTILKNKRQIILAILFFAVICTINYYAGVYTTTKANVSEVQDIILDHLPAIDLSLIFVWLFIAIFAVLYVYPIVFRPDKIAYSFFMIGLWILVRAIFICLTHLKTPASAIMATFPSWFQTFSFNNDMFFSGHAGLPFMCFLIFRKYNKFVGYFMLVASIINSITVLFMHQHYSIDVLSAFFITYGVYIIGDKIFNGDNKK